MSNRPGVVGWQLKVDLPMNRPTYPRAKSAGNWPFPMCAATSDCNSVWQSESKSDCRVMIQTE